MDGRVSECCGAEPETVTEKRGGRIVYYNSEDTGRCPECGAQIEYVDE